MTNTVRKNEFIRWTSMDEQGKFSYIGQVMSAKNGMIMMEESNGSILGFPDDDGTVEVIRKPKNWNVKKPTETKAVKKTATTTVRPKASRSKNGESKLDQVVALLHANPVTSRKEAIEKIVAAGISTPAGASTYYNNAKAML